MVPDLHHHPGTELGGGRLMGNLPGHSWGGHGFSLGKHLGATGANWTPSPCAKHIFE